MYENINFEVSIYLRAKQLLYVNPNIQAEVFEALEDTDYYYDKVDNGLQEQNISTDNLTDKLLSAILDEKYLHVYEDEAYFNLSETSDTSDGYDVVYSVPVSFDVDLFMKDIKEL